MKVDFIANILKVLGRLFFKSLTKPNESNLTKFLHAVQ